MANNDNDKDSKDTNADQTQITESTVVVPVLSYIVTTFDSADDAKKAYKSLKEDQREGLVNIVDAAYVEKTDRSKIKVHDHDDWTVGGGLLAGGVTGAIIGIIGGTILLPAVIGALIGGALTGIYESDHKFSDKDMRKLGDSLPMGSSVLVAIVEDAYVEDVTVEMRRQGGKKTHSAPIPKSTTESLMAAAPKK